MDELILAAKALREKDLALSLSYRKVRRGAKGGWKWVWSARIANENGYGYARNAGSPHGAIEKILEAENINHERKENNKT